MDIYNIDDIRDDFKNITFSKFQKSKAKNEFINALYNSKIENANYWCAEFICAGHFLDIWENILLYTFKYIHYGNPKLTNYLVLRYNNFISILNNGYSSNIIKLRNNDKIRKLFCEIICILCYSNKKPIFNEVKLKKDEEFSLLNLSEKFKANNMSYLKDFIKEDDSKELIIPINEFIFSIESKNIIDSCYWYEWLIEYENQCIKNKKKIKIDIRNFAITGNSNQVIWIIWEILFYYADPETTPFKDKSNVKKKLISDLFSLFTIKYNNTCKRKRKHIIYYSIYLLIEKIDFNVNIINQKEKIIAITEKINIIYKDIKKNEVSPNTDYLFSNIDNKNLEKTVEKMEILNNM